MKCLRGNFINKGPQGMTRYMAQYRCKDIHSDNPFSSNRSGFLQRHNRMYRNDGKMVKLLLMKEQACKKLSQINLMSSNF